MGQRHELSKEQRAAAVEIFQNTRVLNALAQKSGLHVLAYLLEMAAVEAYELSEEHLREVDWPAERRLQP